MKNLVTESFFPVMPLTCSKFVVLTVQFDINYKGSFTYYVILDIGRGAAIIIRCITEYSLRFELPASFTKCGMRRDDDICHYHQSQHINVASYTL